MKFKSVLVIIAAVAPLAFFAAGCGGAAEEGPELLPTTGTVTLDDQPLAGADLTFIPADQTAGAGGTARSDESGTFTVGYARGGAGLAPGNYKVIVSRRLMPDGSPVPEGDTTPPIESPATESLPPKFSDPNQSALTVAVEPGKPLEVKLSSK